MKLTDVPLAASLVAGKNFAALSTIMPDGSSHTSIVWVHHDDKHLIFNTAEGRIKTKNIRRDPRVSLAVWNLENPYQQAMIRGRVVEITHEGADAYIDSLAKKYMGLDKYPYAAPGEVRVLVKVEVEKIGIMG